MDYCKFYVDTYTNAFCPWNLYRNTGRRFQTSSQTKFGQFYFTNGVTLKSDDKKSDRPKWSTWLHWIKQTLSRLEYKINIY